MSLLFTWFCWTVAGLGFLFRAFAIAAVWNVALSKVHMLTVPEVLCIMCAIILLQWPSVNAADLTDHDMSKKLFVEGGSQIIISLVVVAVCWVFIHYRLMS